MLSWLAATPTDVAINCAETCERLGLHRPYMGVTAILSATEFLAAATAKQRLPAVHSNPT